MDVLSDILATIRLESGVFFQSELEAPWGIRTGPQDNLAFHVVARGRCWLEVDGQPGPIAVNAGDVVMLAPGRAHSLRDAPDTATRDIETMIREGAFVQPRHTAGPVDPAVVATQLMCGWFRFSDGRGDVLLSELPPVLHARELTTDVGPWLAQTVRLLSYESLADRPGMATVVNRLCDALFVYVLRSHLASLPPGHPSWLRGLLDPQIGAALQNMHDDPAAAWSVNKLAASVGMSRSTFAGRFSQIVGETPMLYLARWRLRKASAMLREGQLSIDVIAAGTGYGSTAAFTKAFTRTIGTTPGTFRRAARSPVAHAR